MFNKEELLQKGVPEDAADEIISAFSEDEDSLSALQKALDADPEMDELKKAEQEDEESEEDEKEDEKEGEYNEKYMKKYMKRYMKANKKSVQKMMKDLGVAGEKMEKAIDGIDSDSEAAIIEAADLSPYLESQKEFNQEMVKAIESLNERIEVVSAQGEKSYNILQKASKVIVEQAKGMNSFLATPQGRKGVVASAEMKKATEVDDTKFSRDDNRIIYSALMKATKQGDKTAGQVISFFESAGQNANFLNASHKRYIHELLEKEAK